MDKKSKFIKSADFLLSHPWWTGVGAIVGIIGLVFLFQEPKSPSTNLTNDIVCDQFASAFISQDSINESFEDVLVQLEQDASKTILGCDSNPSNLALEKLADHYILERRRYYESYRNKISNNRTATVGRGGSSKKYSLSATCSIPDTTVENGSYKAEGYGGCYPSQPEEGSNSIAGVVSQTGNGKSECTISATCIFTDAIIDTKVAAEEIKIKDRIF